MVCQVDNHIKVMISLKMTKKVAKKLKEKEVKTTEPVSELNWVDRQFLVDLVKNHFVVLDYSDHAAKSLKVDDRKRKLAINDGTRIFLTTLLAKLQK